MSAKKSEFEIKEFDHNLLFQKINEQWYVFAEIDSEILYTAIPMGLDPKKNKFEIYQIVEEKISVLKNSRLRNFGQGPSL